MKKIFAQSHLGGQELKLPSLCFTILAVALWTNGCRQSTPKESTPMSEAFRNIPADEDAIRPTPEERLGILGRAAVSAAWPSDERQQRTVLDGPMQFKFKKGKLVRQQNLEFSFNQMLDCEYINPWIADKPGGKTPKFSCTISYQTENGKIKTKKIKVKYDSEKNQNINTGVYGEPIATRLLWALGYPADTVIPVQIRCKGCPNEPWQHISSYWSLLEKDASLKEVPAGSETFLKTEKTLIADSVRYISETLSRYESLSSLKIIGSGYDYRILNDKGEEIFSTSSGEILLFGQKIPVYDPLQKRLILDANPGIADFKINHLDPTLEKNQTWATREFTSAVIEWKHNSIPIETYYHEGWSFNASTYEPNRTAEIRYVTPNNPSLTIARQELALLAVFMGHADNKAEQQRLICLDAEKIEAEEDDCEKTGDPRYPLCTPGTDVTFTTCENPVMMLQDVGFSMGFGTRVTGVDSAGKVTTDSTREGKSFGTADPKGFLEAPIFKDIDKCVTTVNKWVTGAEIEERITDEARKSLLAKLRKLAENDQDLSDLFRVGRLYLKKLHLDQKPFPPFGSSSSEVSVLESQLINEFKQSFRSKIDKLSSIQCPE